MTSPLTARADVPTATPGRYAKQLVAHLGRKVAFHDVDSPAGAGSAADIGDARGTVVPGEGVLTLLAEAPDEAGLARVQDVLGRHLERFGQRQELVVSWVRPAGESNLA
jgi:hypothetical protein